MDYKEIQIQDTAKVDKVVGVEGFGAIVNLLLRFLSAILNEYLPKELKEF